MHIAYLLIIEIVQLNEDCTSTLADATENGKVNRRKGNISNNHIIENEDVDFPTSFWIQFYVLLGRMILQLTRNKIALCIQLFHHVFVGILLGALFFGIGNKAEMAIENFKYCMFVVFMFMFTHMLANILLFPLEVQLLKREYLNRWYGLKPYFLALTLRSLPSMIILGSIFLVITYLMTDQPLEVRRFLSFGSVCILAALVCESIALVVGSICSITNGSIVGLGIAAPGAFMCIYGMGYGDEIGAVMKIVMTTNYARCALVAISLIIFRDRPAFDCNEIFCQYKHPKHLLKDLGMLDSSFALHISVLIIYFVLFRLIAFFALRYRLTLEFSHMIKNIKLKLIGQS